MWIPPGVEFPSTDLGPAASSLVGPVVVVLTRQVGVEGHPREVITTTLTYQGNFHCRGDDVHLGERQQRVPT